MAHQISFFEDDEVVAVRLSGRVDGVELRSIISAVLTSPRWKPGFSTMWDARPITQLVVAPQDVEEILRLMRGLDERRGTGKTAVVAQGDVDLMIAELLQQSIEFYGPFRTFFRLREAASWLGLTREQLAIFSE